MAIDNYGSTIYLFCLFKKYKLFKKFKFFKKKAE